MKAFKYTFCEITQIQHIPFKSIDISKNLRKVVVRLIKERNIQLTTSKYKQETVIATQHLLLSINFQIFLKLGTTILNKKPTTFEGVTTLY